MLQDYSWPVVDLVGISPGSRLCVMAGMHVNELSSIEAAIRLQSRFDPGAIRGIISIIPTVNVPGLYQHSEYVCPVDGKNINFTFPGRPDGSFSEVLCHSLLSEWASDAAALVDMHGGDLRENVAKFAVFQETGDPALDRRRAEVARCFDADLLVGLDPSHLSNPGRSCTAFAARGGLATLVEAGANGLIDEASVKFHMDGVLNLARLLGIIEGPSSPATRRQLLCRRYLWIETPATGMGYVFVEPGDHVEKGAPLAEVRDVFGNVEERITAPEEAYVLWRMTQPFLQRGDFILGLATPS